MAIWIKLTLLLERTVKEIDIRNEFFIVMEE